MRAGIDTPHNVVREPVSVLDREPDESRHFKVCCWLFWGLTYIDPIVRARGRIRDRAVLSAAYRSLS